MTRFTPQWLQAGSYAASVDRRLIGALWPAAASVGCQVTAGTAMTVNVAPGQVAVPTQNNTGATLCSSDATEQVTLTAAPGTGLNRIDLIICQPRGNDLDGGSNTDFIFTYVTGTAAASPVAPAVPAGSAVLAQIAVGANVASIVAGNITDRRPGGLSVPPAAGASSPALGWIAGGISATTVTVGASATPIMTASFPAVAGRRYRVVFTYNGNQATATGNIQIGIPGAPQTVAVKSGVAAGQNVTAQAEATVLAATTGTMTVNCQALTSAGTCQFLSGWNFWDVHDAGAHP